MEDAASGPADAASGHAEWLYCADCKLELRNAEKMQNHLDTNQHRTHVKKHGKDWNRISLVPPGHIEAGSVDVENIGGEILAHVVFAEHSTTQDLLRALSARAFHPQDLISEEGSRLATEHPHATLSTFLAGKQSVTMLAMQR